MRHRASISAVHDDDLIEFLEGIGVLHDVKSAKAKCKFCHDCIDLTSLALVFPEGGDIKFICYKPACLKALADYRSELRGSDSSKQMDIEYPDVVAHDRQG
jgi:hypothetical protein